MKVIFINNIRCVLLLVITILHTPVYINRKNLHYLHSLHFYTSDALAKVKVKPSLSGKRQK